MTFTAKLKRHARIWTMWRNHHRVGGVLAGVEFRWVAGDDYVTGELASPQIAALKGHPDVVMEIASNAPLPSPIEATEPEKPVTAVAAEPQLTTGTLRLPPKPTLPPQQQRRR